MNGITKIVFRFILALIVTPIAVLLLDVFAGFVLQIVVRCGSLDGHFWPVKVFACYFVGRYEMMLAVGVAMRLVPRCKKIFALIFIPSIYIFVNMFAYMVYVVDGGEKELLDLILALPESGLSYLLGMVVGYLAMCSMSSVNKSQDENTSRVVGTDKRLPGVKAEEVNAGKEQLHGKAFQTFTSVVCLCMLAVILLQFGWFWYIGRFQVSREVNDYIDRLANIVVAEIIGFFASALVFCASCAIVRVCKTCTAKKDDDTWSLISQVLYIIMVLLLFCVIVHNKIIY